MPAATSAPARQSGFTLVELLSVVAIAGVLLSVALSPLTTLVDSVAVSAAANDLLGDLYLARSQAVQRRQRVVVCKSADGVRCAATGGWEQGWLVFVDLNNDGLRADNEPLLQRQTALRTSLRFSGNSTVSQYVSYAPTGATRLVNGGFQSGTLTVCAESAAPGNGRQVVLGAGGRPRVQKVRVAACA